MKNNKSYIKSMLIICILMCIADRVCCQIARDIALKFLYLDINRDNLLSTQQMGTYNGTKNTTDGISPGQQNSNKQVYYYWKQFQLYTYPQRTFRKFDIDQDQKLSFLQLSNIVQFKLKRHTELWPKNHTNILNILKTQDYLNICDASHNEYLQKNQLINCFKAFLLYQFKYYPYKIKSLLYPNRTIGYEYEQFKQLLPKSKKRGQKSAEKQFKFLFDNFEWPQKKIKQDTDLLVGPQQGRFMEPTLLYFYLDANWDQVLDKQQALKFLNNHGGQEAFKIADYNSDGQLDQAELIAYFMFAMCIDDCLAEQQSSQQVSGIIDDLGLLYDENRMAKKQLQQSIANKQSVQVLTEEQKELKNELTKTKAQQNIKQKEQQSEDVKKQQKQILIKNKTKKQFKTAKQPKNKNSIKQSGKWSSRISNRKTKTNKYNQKDANIKQDKKKLKRVKPNMKVKNSKYNPKNTKQKYRRNDQQL